nr:hypothetical protein [Tanacetum cinerariifolium]
MKDVPVIVLSDGESDVRVSSKHRVLSKNSAFVNNNEESDEDFTIRFKRLDNHKLPSIPKTLIDESTDDDVANSTDVKEYFEYDEDFTIRFKRSDYHKLPSVPKTLIDQSMDDDVANSTDVKDEPWGMGYTITFGPRFNQMNDKHDGSDISPESHWPGCSKTDADRFRLFS